MPESQELSLAVLTWNMLRVGGIDRTERKLAALAGRRWDVACLQEVSAPAWAAIQQAEWLGSGVHGCDLGGWPDWKQPNGAALVVREDLDLLAPVAIDALPVPGRAVVATIRKGATDVLVCSWHAPNAAGDGVSTKMDAYRALVSWLDTTNGAVILGCDTNHWNLRVTLEPPDVPDSADRWLFENQFFGSRPQHRLRDALLDALSVDPARYAAILAERPDGPLEVSHKRGSTLDRFDYIFVSPEVDVETCEYDYTGGLDAGSDHGFVQATLTVSQ